MIDRNSYIQQIKPFMNNPLIKVITGIRRAGKSVMLELIQKELIKEGVQPEQCITYNFESFKTVSLKDAYALYQDVTAKAAALQGRAYLFFDEIQEVKDWEQCINSLRVDLDCDIYLTGSNAHLLSGELSTYLAGRYIQFMIQPFSLKEYIDCLKDRQLFTTEEQAFRSYLIYGGMPALADFTGNHQATIQYLQDICSTVVLKDIIGRNKVRDVDLLERIILYLMANTGRTFSANSLFRYFKSEGRKASVETILNYIHMCEEAFLIHKVRREDIEGKKLLTVNEKYYLTDHGLREAMYGHNERDLELVLENIVYLELVRRGYQVQIGKLGTKEIDFTAVKNNQKLYFQVCYLLASPETKEREFGAFGSIKDNYPKYVLSMDPFDFSQDGIHHMNIPKFLLEQDCLG